ncbi:MAG: universal stress protein [Desulfobacterales bacterium]|nr:universal stress protein [Desulfobacterales bacterium]
MEHHLFHIFRNTPFGRETLLQSLYFCRTVGVAPILYIPEHTKFLMYFENDVVQVDLDSAYLTAPETARDHAETLLREAGFEPDFFSPKHFTASTLPDVTTQFDFMCCPRSVSDLSSKIGLGYIGPRVRRIVRSARFPVLITSPVFKPWKSVSVFFGGSHNAVKALRLGLRICRESGFPLDVFTQAESRTRQDYEQIVEERGLKTELDQHLRHWEVFDQGRIKENLYGVPHDALVVLGAFGHGLIRDFVFGSKMETIQSTVSNNLLIAGPSYTAAL